MFTFVDSLITIYLLDSYFVVTEWNNNHRTNENAQRFCAGIVSQHPPEHLLN